MSTRALFLQSYLTTAAKTRINNQPINCPVTAGQTDAGRGHFLLTDTVTLRNVTAFSHSCWEAWTSAFMLTGSMCSHLYQTLRYIVQDQCIRTPIVQRCDYLLVDWRICSYCLRHAAHMHVVATRNQCSHISCILLPCKLGICLWGLFMLCLFVVIGAFCLSATNTNKVVGWDLFISQWVLIYILHLILLYSHAYTKHCRDVLIGHAAQTGRPHLLLKLFPTCTQ